MNFQREIALTALVCFGSTTVAVSFNRSHPDDHVHLTQEPSSWATNANNNSIVWTVSPRSSNDNNNS